MGPSSFTSLLTEVVAEAAAVAGCCAFIAKATPALFSYSSRELQRSPSCISTFCNLIQACAFDSEPQTSSLADELNQIPRASHQATWHALGKTIELTALSFFDSLFVLAAIEFSSLLLVGWGEVLLFAAGSGCAGTSPTSSKPLPEAITSIYDLFSFPGN